MENCQMQGTHKQTPNSKEAGEVWISKEGHASTHCSPTCNGIICIDDPHGRGVGHRRHAGLLPLLLVSVDDEQCQQEEHNEDKDDDARNGADLIGISGQGGAGPA